VTLLSGTLTPTISASFTNSTGSTITTLSIAYVGEQWRLGASGRGPDRLDLQYSMDATMSIRSPLRTLRGVSVHAGKNSESTPGVAERR
jgi:hypothetical protein